MFLPITLPSTHGGHSSIDNHRPWWSGFSPDDAKQNLFLPDQCPTCPGHDWCYNLKRPTNFAGQVASLAAIYHCYQESARRVNIDPFCVTVHAPFPRSFEQWFESRAGGQPFRQLQIQMPNEDFPIFLAAVTGIEYAAVEFEVLPEPYSAEVQKQIALIKQTYPWLIRIASLHHVEIDGEIYRQGKKERDRTVAVFNRVGSNRFWTRVLATTLEAVKTMDAQVLGHPFGWQKRLPEKCSFNDLTEPVVEEIAETLAKRGIFVDLNSSGMWKGSFQDNPYLPAEWVAVFQSKGVRFTCGDDSHNQRQIGQCYDRLLEFCTANDIKQLWRPKFKAFDQPLGWEAINL